MWLNIKGSLLQIQISYFFPQNLSQLVCVCARISGAGRESSNQSLLQEVVEVIQ